MSVLKGGEIMTAHNRIKELRNEKGLSQKEFAKAFSDFVKNDKTIKSVSYATISRWERGENEPKLETWVKLADFFDVPVLYLQGVSNSKITLNNIDRFIKNEGFDMSSINSALDDKDIHTYKRLINAYHGRKKPNSKIDPRKEALLYRDLILENNISDSKKFVDFTRLFGAIYHAFLLGYGNNDQKSRELYEKVLNEMTNKG